MPIEVELPDGTIAEFPDGTSNDVMKGALARYTTRAAPPTTPDLGVYKNAPLTGGQVAVDEMGFGYPGKIAAGINALARAPFTDKSISEEYGTLRDQYKNARDAYAKENPTASIASSIAGSLVGGAALERAGAEVLGRVFPRVVSALQSTYAGRMAADAANGFVQGGLSAAGHDQDIAPGAIIGGVLGGAARPVIGYLGGMANGLGGLVGLGNQSRANSALSEALTRSGRGASDVVGDLTAARAAGQPEYRVVDAMGNAGQRMLTGIVRSPGDERQPIVEALLSRQGDQGRRLQTALEDGFGAPQTAAQTEAARTSLRQTEGRVNYNAARADAGTVNPSSAIQAADEFLGTGGSLPLTNIADDSVEGAVRRARGMLTDGNNVVSDFDSAFRAKIELDNMIERASGPTRTQLYPIRNALDAELERASSTYADARDTFRRQSQDIESVDTGRQAAMRGRVEDTVPAFNGMTDTQQAGYRSGYADAYIAPMQAQAGPMSNKARPLISDSSAVEFPAFAIPGQERQLMDRIAREQTMFETTNQALGGSRTAENLADMMDMQGFDPSMLGALATGGIKGAALKGLQMAVNSVNGRNQQTRDMIARVLMESDPTRANAALASAVASGQRLTGAQERVVQALITSAATLPSRLQDN